MDWSITKKVGLGYLNNSFSRAPVINNRSWYFQLLYLEKLSTL